LELTDAIATLMKMGHKVRCVKLQPEELRYDIGNLESYFKAFIDFTLFDQRYGYLIRQYLQNRLREF
jgi:UTP--glucose-1-phosphate uridylyltransferase